MKKLIGILCLWGIAGIVLSCEKVAGEGRSSSVSGKLRVSLMTKSGLVIDEYYAPEERVYLLYGEQDEIYDDWMRTSYNGGFAFKELKPGKYTVFAYSECTDCENGVEAKKVQFRIEKSRTHVELEDLIVTQYD